MKIEKLEVHKGLQKEENKVISVNDPERGQIIKTSLTERQKIKSVKHFNCKVGHGRALKYHIYRIKNQK